MFKIVIADDHPLIRSGIKATLSASEDFQVIAEAPDFSEVLALVEGNHPDLLILDVEMPGGKAEVLIAQARELLPNLKILILTGHDSAPTVRAVMKAKVSGYLLKHEAPEHLLQAVRVISSGATWFSQGIMARMLESEEEQDDLLVTLSPREKQIFEILAAGKDNAAIAAEVHLAEQTVRNTVSSIYSKLGLATRVEAVVLASTRGWFQGARTQAP